MKCSALGYILLSFCCIALADPPEAVPNDQSEPPIVELPGIADVHTPHTASAKRDAKHVVVKLTIHRDGSIEKTEIVESSGDPAVDKIALKIVNKPGKYPSIPASTYPKTEYFAFLIPINFAPQ